MQDSERIHLTKKKGGIANFVIHRVIVEAGEFRNSS